LLLGLELLLLLVVVFAVLLLTGQPCHPLLH
jgi:hypothetical protein